MANNFNYIGPEAIYPSWSKFVPLFLKGLLFPPLAQLYRHFYDKSGNLWHLQISISYAYAALATTPKNHPSLPHYQGRLANSLYSRFVHLGDITDLQLAYMLQTSSLNATPRVHSDVDWHRRNLQITNSQRYQIFGRLEDLETCISLGLLALSQLPQTSRHIPWWQQSLSIHYQFRHTRFRRSEDLDAQLKWALAALDASAHDDPALPTLLHTVGQAYSQKFTESKEMVLMDLALFWTHSSVSRTPPVNQAELAIRRHALSTLYSRRFRFSGNLDDLQVAINLAYVPIDMLPKSLRALYFHNISLCHTLRNGRLGNDEDMNSAVLWALKSIEGSSEVSPNRGLYAARLAEAVFDRYQRFGNLDDLESAVKWSEISVIKAGDGSLLSSLHQYNLSIMLHSRYQRHRHRNDLDLAFQWCKSAITLTRPDDPELSQRQFQLGILYRGFFSLSMDISHLNMALELQQLVIEVTHPTHHRAPDRYKEFAGLHSYIYHYKGGSEHSEASMNWNWKALDASSPDDANRHSYLFSLSIGYYNRFIRLSSLEDLELSLRLGDDALFCIPTDHPQIFQYYQVLAEVYAERYRLMGDSEDRKRTLAYFQRAADALNGHPDRLWKTIQRWAAFADMNRLPECIEAYSAGYRILPELFWLGSDMKSRHETLIEYKVANFSARAITACIKYGHLERAVEFLEQSLALTFQQLLDLRTNLSVLKEKFPVYASMLETVSFELQKLASTSIDEEHRHDWDRQRKLAIDRGLLLKKIRELPSFSDFLLPVTFRSLATVSEFGPVIAINCSGLLCDAMILLQDGAIVHLTLPGVRMELISRQCEKLQTALKMCGIRSRQLDSDDRAVRICAFRSIDSETAIKAVLSWIWTSIVSPIFNRLETKGVTAGRIWWCLAGPLTYLPLHAAGPPNAYIQSYTSSLSALIRARSSLTVIKNPKIFAVGLSELKEGGMSGLPKVKDEVEALKETVGEEHISIFMNEDATLEKIGEVLPQSTWLHLACHGQQGNAQNPLRSGLLLYDGTKLELEKIINTPIPNASFAFLSACETAMGDADMTGESLHLAGGMIFAGFKAVIGTLWSINDQDGPIVARAVYSHVFKHAEGPDVRNTAEALHIAVQDLRRRGTPPHRWVPFIHIGI